MQVRVRLKEFLDEHHVSPAKLSLALRGQVAQGSIYALLKSDRVKRVDLNTLSGLLGALREIIGREVHVGDLLEELEEGNTALAELLQGRRPVAWSDLKAASAGFTQEELDLDRGFWDDRGAARTEELRKQDERFESWPPL